MHLQSQASNFSLSVSPLVTRNLFSMSESLVLSYKFVSSFLNSIYISDIIYLSFSELFSIRIFRSFHVASNCIISLFMTEKHFIYKCTTILNLDVSVTLRLLPYLD